MQTQIRDIQISNDAKKKIVDKKERSRSVSSARSSSYPASATTKQIKKFREEEKIRADLDRRLEDIYKNSEESSTSESPILVRRSNNYAMPVAVSGPIRKHDPSKVNISYSALTRTREKELRSVDGLKNYVDKINISAGNKFREQDEKINTLASITQERFRIQDEQIRRLEERPNTYVELAIPPESFSKFAKWCEEKNVNFSSSKYQEWKHLYNK